MKWSNAISRVNLLSENLYYNIIPQYLFSSKYKFAIKLLISLDFAALSHNRKCAVNFASICKYIRHQKLTSKCTLAKLNFRTSRSIFTTRLFHGRKDFIRMAHTIDGHPGHSLVDLHVWYFASIILPVVLRVHNAKVTNEIFTSIINEVQGAYDFSYKDIIADTSGWNFLFRSSTIQDSIKIKDSLILRIVISKCTYVRNRIQENTFGLHTYLYI